MNKFLKVIGGLVLASGVGIVAVDSVQDDALKRFEDIFNSNVLGMSATGKVLGSQPKVMLWAWQYPSDLKFIDSETVGVAYLSGKFILRSNSVIVEPRVQKLLVPNDTYMTAVMRIDVDHGKNAATLSDAQLEELTKKMISLLSTKKVQVLQIDFDALASERPFYRKLLTALRKQMPHDMPLSITSLASWCLGDKWLSDSKCDQVVPMFFSMGKDRQRMLNYLKEHAEFDSIPKEVCIGLSVNEPDVLAQLHEPTSVVYLFSSNGWESDRAKEWINKFQCGGSNWKELAKQN